MMIRLSKRDAKRFERITRWAGAVWSVETRCMAAVEEMAELAVGLCKAANHKKHDADNVREEIVDVLIMLHQVADCFYDDPVEFRRVFRLKLNKLNRKVKPTRGTIKELLVKISDRRADKSPRRP